MLTEFLCNRTQETKKLVLAVGNRSFVQLIFTEHLLCAIHPSSARDWGGRGGAGAEKNTTLFLSGGSRDDGEITGWDPGLVWMR